MATTAVSPAASRGTAQDPSSRWLREALERASLALRQQTKTATEPTKIMTCDCPPLQDVAYWVKGCAFAGQQIDTQSLIYATQHSFCFLAPRPVVPGHAIVCPRRPVKALFDLPKEEADDMFLAAQVLSWLLTAYCRSTATTLRLQQGEGARQALLHLFVHVVPRKANDLSCSDDIYFLLDEAIPVFPRHTFESRVGDAQGTIPHRHGEQAADWRHVEPVPSAPQRLLKAHTQENSPSVGKCENKTLSPAEYEQQSQAIRLWLSNLAFD